jgi:octaheme c-type cytochrome (tetrathionate reductase family)
VPRSRAASHNPNHKETLKMKTTPNLYGLISAALVTLFPVLSMAEHPLEIDSYTDASTCLTCHRNVDTDIMASIHWTWETTDEFTGKEVGKKNVINNYCIAVASNEPRCTSCHIGVGWRDDTFDFSDSSQIDCLVCHDQTGTYKKVPTGAGAPDPSVDLLAVAQSSGKPTRNNCGTCHYYGGGAEGVKLGSMDSSLNDPSRELDVHMGGAMNMDCASCHVPDDDEPHMIIGSRYSKSTPDNMLCQDCHTAEPHSSGNLNSHSSRVACQTCHIPTYARGGVPTKMYWDWSTAGEKNEDGSDKTIVDENGYVTYQTKKGTFEWAENVVPEYRWFNGNVTHVTLDDTVMPGEIVTINQLEGSVDDEGAYIFPVKRFVGLQPYDSGANTLAVPNLFPNDANDTDALWKSYDWEKALASGMAAAGKSYTGPVGYVETEMYWIQNHMVAPKEQSLQCADCHTYGSRMNFAQLGYAPERAEQLQLMMQSDFWAGYPVSDNFVDTGDWLGWLYVGDAPWVFCYNLSDYLYIDEDAVSEAGGWVYAPK